eukprot:6184589-Pleurochrysis_carterae.AAC.1
MQRNKNYTGAKNCSEKVRRGERKKRNARNIRNVRRRKLKKAEEVNRRHEVRAAEEEGRQIAHEDAGREGDEERNQLEW